MTTVYKFQIREDSDGAVPSIYVEAMNILSAIRRFQENHVDLKGFLPDLGEHMWSINPLTPDEFKEEIIDVEDICI